MKKIVILVFLFFFVQNLVFCQQDKVYKWRASFFSQRLNPENNTKWTDWQTSNVLIVAQNQRVKIYSSTPQEFDMIAEVSKDFDKDENPIYTVMCVDENGTKCKMVWYHTEKDGSYVIFYYSNLEMMYKVESLN